MQSSWRDVCYSQTSLSRKSYFSSSRRTIARSTVNIPISTWIGTINSRGRKARCVTWLLLWATYWVSSLTRGGLFHRRAKNDIRQNISPEIAPLTTEYHLQTNGSNNHCQVVGLKTASLVNGVPLIAAARQCWHDLHPGERYISFIDHAVIRNNN